MEPETLTLPKYEYVGVSLALGVAAQLLTKAYGFDVNYWTELMMNAANKQLAELSPEEINLIVSRREQLKNQVTNNEHNHN